MSHPLQPASPAAAPPEPPDRRDLLAGAALAALLLGLYHRALLPDLPGSGDSAKLQLVGELLGTPHATGYPAWVLLCHALDQLLPLGSPAYRANLLSALCSVLGTLLVAATLRRQGLGRTVAFAAAATLGLTPTLWSQSVMAEVYTLNYLFAAAVIYLLLRWRQGRRPALLAAALAIWVLSFTNHLTTVCLAPGIAAFVLWVEPAALRRGRLWAVLVATGAGTLLAYAYIVACTYWLQVPYLEMQAVDLHQLLDNLGGGPHRSHLLELGWGDLLRARLPRIAGLVLGELSVLLVLPVLGAWGRPTPRAALLGLTLLANLAFLAVYTVPDLYVYAIPSYLVLSLYLGLGLQRLVDHWPLLRRPAGSILLGLPALLLLWQGPGAEQQGQRQTQAEHLDRVIHVLADQQAVLYSLDYDASMGLLYRSRLGAPELRGIAVQHLPPAALGVPVSLQPLRRYLETGEPFRVGPQGQLMAPGVPVYAYVPRPEYLAALARRGVRAAPAGNGVFRLSADPTIQAPPPLPRAFVVHQVATVTTVRAALAAFAEPGFDPRHQALRLGWEAEDPAEPSAPASQAAPEPQVQLLRYDDHEVTATVELAAPGWLVLADSFSSRWAASVDGRPVTSPDLDLLFRGIPVPAGRHQIRFSATDRRLSWRDWWLGWGT